MENTCMCGCKIYILIPAERLAFMRFVMSSAPAMTTTTGVDEVAKFDIMSAGFMSEFISYEFRMQTSLASAAVFRVTIPEWP